MQREYQSVLRLCVAIQSLPEIRRRRADNQGEDFTSAAEDRSVEFHYRAVREPSRPDQTDRIISVTVICRTPSGRDVCRVQRHGPPPAHTRCVFRVRSGSARPADRFVHNAKGSTTSPIISVCPATIACCSAINLGLLQSGLRLTAVDRLEAGRLLVRIR